MMWGVWWESSFRTGSLTFVIDLDLWNSAPRHRHSCCRENLIRRGPYVYYRIHAYMYTFNIYNLYNVGWCQKANFVLKVTAKERRSLWTRRIDRPKETRYHHGYRSLANFASIVVGDPKLLRDVATTIHNVHYYSLKVSTNSGVAKELLV